MVPRTGLEPARFSTLAPETSASTIPPPGHCPWAENEARTRDPNLGKVVLYQLSYFRIGCYASFLQTKIQIFKERAENEARTRDPNLGKVVLYQLSYFRVCERVVVLCVSLNGCKGIAFFLTSKTFWVFFWRKCKIFAKTSQKGGFLGKKGPFYAKSGTTFGKKQFRHPQTATNKINLFIAVFFKKEKNFIKSTSRITSFLPEHRQ